MADSNLTIVLAIVVPWLILILASSRIDLEKRGMLIAPGILLWRTERVDSILNRFEKRLKWVDKFASLSIKVVLVLFYAFPILLIVNVVLAFTNIPIPFFVANPIVSLSFESIILIIIPLVFSLLLHEFFHAITARSQNVEVERAGIAIVLIFLAAFVQMVPDSLRNVSKKSKMKIVSSSIMANFVLAIILIPILATSSVLVTPLYHDSEGALITRVYDDSPAMEAGITRGQIITGIQYLQNGIPSFTQNVSSANELIAYLRDISAGTEFNLKLLFGEQLITGIDPPSGSNLIGGSYLGIELYDYRPGRVSFLSPFLPYWFQVELKWLININLVLSLINLLPLPLTDGGQIAEIILIDAIKIENLDRVKKVIWILTAVIVGFNLLVTIF